MKDELVLKAMIDIESFPDLYKLIDFLNKNLKEKNIVFGLSKKDESTMSITIYNID
jgi:hypothetical protein